MNDREEKILECAKVFNEKLILHKSRGRHISCNLLKIEVDRALIRFRT